MKHIAVISNMYYPVMGATSAVIDKYLRELKEDYTFHIITKTYEIDFPPSEEFDIFYISSFRHRLYQRCMYNVKKGNNVLLSKLLLFLVRISMVIQNQWSFPTSRRWEINAYYQQLVALYEKYHIDTVIAVSDNFVSQLAMLKFKERYQNVKWIALILDPYHDLFVYYKYKLIKCLWKKANERKELEIYKKADYLLFSIEMYNHVIEIYDIDKNKIFPLYFTLNKDLSDGSFSCDENVSSLVYAGGFYKEIRNPEFALSSLSLVANMRLTMYLHKGDCDDIVERFLSNRILRKCVVGRKEYIDILKYKCDILVNVGNKSSLQAPSKMLELLSTGKPIINFSFSKDSQYEMIEKYPLGINIMDQDKDAPYKITEFCKRMKGKKMQFEEILELFPDNNISNQVKNLKGLIEM